MEIVVDFRPKNWYVWNLEDDSFLKLPLFQVFSLLVSGYISGSRQQQIPFLNRNQESRMGRLLDASHVKDKQLGPGMTR